MIHFRDMCTCELFVEVMPPFLPSVIYLNPFSIKKKLELNNSLLFSCYFCLVFNPSSSICNFLIVKPRGSCANIYIYISIK